MGELITNGQLRHMSMLTQTADVLLFYLFFYMNFHLFMNAIRHVSLTHYPPPPLSSLTVPYHSSLGLPIYL